MAENKAKKTQTKKTRTQHTNERFSITDPKRIKSVELTLNDGTKVVPAGVILTAVNEKTERYMLISNFTNLELLRVSEVVPLVQQVVTSTIGTLNEMIKQMVGDLSRLDALSGLIVDKLLEDMDGASTLIKVTYALDLLRAVAKLLDVGAYVEAQKRGTGGISGVHVVGMEPGDIPQDFIKTLSQIFGPGVEIHKL